VVRGERVHGGPLRWRERADHPISPHIQHAQSGHCHVGTSVGVEPVGVGRKVGSVCMRESTACVTVSIQLMDAYGEAFTGNVKVKCTYPNTRHY
jgi:hypothetical protein